MRVFFFFFFGYYYIFAFLPFQPKWTQGIFSFSFFVYTFRVMEKAPLGTLWPLSQESYFFFLLLSHNYHLFYQQSYKET